MKMCVWSIGGIILRRKTEVLGDKPLLTPLCPPEKSRGIAWDQSRILALQGSEACFYLTVNTQSPLQYPIG
jgi:hypothetical protein